MGPAATATLFSRIVELTDVSTDQEHIEIEILNVPSVPDRTDFILGRPGAQSFVPKLQDMALKLESDGCHVLAMPCNAAHARHDDISSVLQEAYLLNILDETASFTKSHGCSVAGLLATDGIISSGAYQNAFEDAGIDCIVPEDLAQQRVMSAIYDYVKSGIEAPEGFLDSVCDSLIGSGADCLILGCTELALLGIPAAYKDMPVIDSIDALAVGAIRKCGYPVKNL